MSRAVRAWLLFVCSLIVLMVAVGGITRLTGSGLSITDWKPLMGAIPPLSDADWAEVFGRYKASPQGQTLNAGMSLSEFKYIFFWEYIHRLLGRVIGLAFFFPWLWFVVRGQVRGALAKKLFVAFVLGGLQGVLGWFMVMSGLVDRPYVSHLRLAAHLLLALLVLCYLFWILLEHGGIRRAQAVPPAWRRAIGAMTALLVLQIAYGAFVAGLKAGYAYPTFPKMHGAWLPAEAWMHEPAWLNLFEAPAMVQFIHRWIGAALLIAWPALYLRAKGQALLTELAAPLGWVSILVFVQFLLGVATVLGHVPITVAVAHQLFACFLLLAVVRVNFLARS